MGNKKPRVPGAAKKTDEVNKTEIERKIEELKKQLTDFPDENVGSKAISEKIGKLTSFTKIIKLHYKFAHAFFHTHVYSEKKECKFCDETVTKNNMARHIKTVHKQLKPYHCSKCEQGFTTKTNMMNHEIKCVKEKADEEKC